MLALFVDDPHVVQILVMLGIGAILVIAGCLLLDFLVELLDRFSRLGWACKIGVLFLVVQLTMFGGAKHGGTNDVTNVDGTNQVAIVGGGGQSNLISCNFGLEEGRSLHCPPPPLLSTSRIPFTDVARGYRLESVVTNDNISYAMPSNGVVRGTWHLTGAYEDVQEVSLIPHSSSPIPHPFLFPLGTNLCSSLWTYTWGKVRSRLSGTGVSPVQGWPAQNGQDARSTCEISAVGAPMSAIPEMSRFWTAATSNDTYLMTWENFALGRILVSTNTSSLIPHSSSLVSAQLELSRNGDFITRSNNVESVYRRVIEPNPEPLDPYGPVQDLSVINETNAYCWVDIVVNNADAWMVFEGDGPSNLADPRFAAKAGETNHVVILIGKTYKVTCDMEFTVVAKSDPIIDVWWEDDHTLWLNWPVTIEAWEGNGNSFRMHVVPGCLGGTFVWAESNCLLGGSGLSFSYSCDTNSLCPGCAAKGHYDYEGYAKDCIGGWCGCNYVPDEPPIHDDEDDEPATRASVCASFSKNAIIFEDQYEPSDGVIVPRRSTESTLTCSACGGQSGGEATFSIVGDGKLVTVTGRSLPFSQHVGPGENFSVEIVYQGKKGAASVVEVTGSFVSNDPDEQVSDSVARIDVVEIEIMCQVQAPANDSCYRHKFGVGEKINCNHYPSNISLCWTSTTGNNVSNEGVYTCPFFIASNPLTAVCGNANFTPSIQVVKPTGIDARNPRCLTYHIPAGRAGWVGLKQDFYVMPLDVSFNGIAMEEVPSTVGSRSGYFSDPAFSVIGCHSFAQGAGQWLKVRDNNLMGYDTASLTLELLRVDNNGNFTEDMSYGWRTGWIIWAIPFGWASGEITTLGSTAQLIEQFDPNAGARFDIAADGDVTATKFGNAAKREINGTFRLNGAICTPENE